MWRRAAHPRSPRRRVAESEVVVPAGGSGPIVPRRRIAAELRRLREERGLTLDQVAGSVLISTSKLSRLENAQGSPQLRDVRDLIREYGIADTPLAVELTQWTHQARQTAWWVDQTHSVASRPPGFDNYVSFESEAERAWAYTIPHIPVLLQTEAYAREWYRATEAPDEATLRDLVRLRMRRQDVLTTRHPRPLQLVAVTHEATLRQLVGSREIMKEQLDALLADPGDHVELRVFPFTSAPTYTVSCPFFEFADGSGGEAEASDQGGDLPGGVPSAADSGRFTVSIETHAGFRHIETPETVATYRERFGTLLRRSLDRDASRKLIEQIAETFA
jgi:transcriptional regulator with XRE-family HTH domain